MKRDAIIATIAAVVIGLQGWILLEVVTMRERVAIIETKMSFYARDYTN